MRNQSPVNNGRMKLIFTTITIVMATSVAFCYQSQLGKKPDSVFTAIDTLFVDSMKVNIIKAEARKIINNYSKINIKPALDPTVLYVTSTDSLIFCGGIEDETPVGVSNVFIRNKGKGYIYVFYKQNEPLQLRKMKVKIYSSESNGDAFDQLVEEKSYNVRPRWKHTYFKYPMRNTGNFLFQLFDDQNRLIGIGYITIIDR